MQWRAQMFGNLLSADRLLRNTLFVVCVLSFLVAGFTAFAEDTGGGDSGKTTGKVAISGSEVSASDTPLPDLFTGTMSYNIPLEVPAGRKGVDPGLALTYRSSNGDGWLGVGWELEMGAIERSIRNGVDYNGNEYILRAPGGASELVKISDSEYRAKIEGNFIRFIKSGVYWEATDRKGIRYRFGYYDSTRQYLDSANVFKWCLDRIEDPNGNYISISYSKDAGQIYLDEIDYTGNDTDAPRLYATNYVKFILEARDDAPNMYTTNFQVTTGKRLKTIEMFANNAMFKKYELTYIANPSSGALYSPTSSRSLLGIVTEYGSDGKSKPPITLQYAQLNTSATGLYGIRSGTETVELDTTTWNGGPSPGLPIDNKCLPGDFNGDGKEDIACYYNGTWNVTSTVKSSGLDSFETNSWINGPVPASSISMGQQCITGDFKGEGKIGFTCYSGANGVWQMALPAGDRWAGPTTWDNGPTPTLPLNECFAGDFDGNVKTDFACYTGANGTWQMALSTGIGWDSARSQWTGGPNPAKPGDSCLTGDFDGNGKTDFACCSGSSFTWNMWLSNGNGWDESDWMNGLNIKPGIPISNQCLTGDFNGDGKTDIGCYVDSTFYVLLANGNIGKSWQTSQWAIPQLYADLPLRAQCVTGDFNGDGKTDIACYNSGNWNVSLSTGQGWTSSTWPNGPAKWDDRINNACFTGDFDGSGKTDLGCYSGSGDAWNMGLAFAPATDLLTSVSNGLGSTVYVEYTPSTRYANTQLPFPVQTVSAVTVTDGNGNYSTTRYEYSGGYFHAGEKDFRGFNYVKTSGPVGPGGEQTITETWFHQGNDTAVDDNAPSATIGFMKGKPYRTRISDAQGLVYSETETAYIPDNPQVSTPYHFNPPQLVYTYTCDGNATGHCKGTSAARQAWTIYNYDDYGNVIREFRFGNPGNLSDPLLNMTVTRTFSPNVDKWIVGLPATEEVFQGTGDSNADTNLLVSRTDYYYDDLPLADCDANPTNNQMPTNGNLTRIVRWLNGGISPETRMAYDSIGNPVCVRDPNGNVTVTEYDAAYKTFPVTNINAKKYPVTSTYYGVNSTANKGLFGQPERVTDPNGATITAEYDPFGRKTLDIQPDNFWTRTAHNSFGSVGSQHIFTDNQSGMWTASYFDGLGRTFKERKSGPDGKTIVTETVYDQRGMVLKKSLPYFETLEAPVWRIYSYDALGRVTGVTNPDGTSTLACFSDLVSVFIDENGHRRRETRDPLGRLVNVEEYEGVYSDCSTSKLTPYASTTYAYDVLGNLTSVTDAKGNSATIEYDTLGRKKNMFDLDMGYWEYEYYNDGSVKSIMDGNYVITKYYYDKLNRLTTKEYPNNAGLTAYIRYNYDEPTSSNPLGRLTSMTDESGMTTWHYDKSGRIERTVKNVDGVDYKIVKTYDGLGRVTSISYPDNDMVNYDYDLGGNITDVRGYVAIIDYNALGQPGKIIFGNGITTTYRYYQKNYRLFALKTDRLQESLIYRTYAYDAKGNVSRVSDLVNPSTPHNLAFDTVTYYPWMYTHSIGYTTTVTGSTSTNRYYYYDNNGNLIWDQQREMTYNSDNQPTSVWMNNETTTFTYDGSGLRVKKTAPTHKMTYIDNLYECVDGTPTCLKYIFAGKTRIAAVLGVETFFYHPDHLGSTSVVTDMFGDKVEDVAYYPFGETRQDVGTTPLPNKYTGQELDYETGLYNFGARFYDPEVGRFITPDSVVPNPSNPQSLNRYAYALNNPMRFVDPTGHYYEDSGFDWSFPSIDWGNEIGSFGSSSLLGGDGSGFDYNWNDDFGSNFDFSSLTDLSFTANTLSYSLSDSSSISFSFNENLNYSNNPKHI